MRLIAFLFFIFFISFVDAQTAEEQEMLDLVNELRADRGLELLQLNTALNKAAFDHSDDMAKNDYFSHTGLNNSNFSQRAIAAGYLGSPRGENIAAGNSAVEATFNQWKNSSGHLNNMLNSNINEMGIGHAFHSNSTYRHYWTQIFGKGDTTLSTDDIASVDARVNVYPNPIKDKVTIEFNNFIDTDNFNIKIVSISGQLIYNDSKKIVNSKITLNIQNLTAGIYFLYVGNNVEAMKIVKL